MKEVLKTQSKVSIYFEKFQSIISLLIFFGVWEVVVRLLKINEAFICTPSSAISHLLFPQTDANYHWKVNIFCTFYEFVLGFGVTAVAGIIISVILVWSKTAQKIVMPLFVFFNSLPIVAITPLMVIWIGYGLKTNIFIAFLASFFPMVINTMAGLNNIDHDLLDLVKYLNASKAQIFWKIRLPNALQYVFAALKICSTLSVMGVIVGELIASDKGLGYVIANSQKAMDTPPMFGSLIVMSLFGWGMYLFVSMLEHLCMPWQFVKQIDK